MSERFEGGYRFADLVERMNAANFDFVDALRLSRTRSGKLVHMDCVFKRRQ